MKIKYCDVVFPLKLSSLTYSVPEDLNIKPGLLVEAPLKGRSMRGVVIGFRDGGPEVNGEVLSIKKVIIQKPILSEPLLKLLTWMSAYYFSVEGMVLRSMIPSFVFKKDFSQVETPPVNIPPSNTFYTASYFRGDIINNEDFHKMLYTLSCVIILAPAHDDVKRIHTILSPIFKDRICEFHSKMKRSELRMVYRDIFSDKYNVILGVMNAIFLPVKPSMIVVIEEGSFSYRSEKIPKFNIRDVSVMRAYIENIPVILTSRIPSIETLYNVKTGKYKLFRGFDIKSKEIIFEHNMEKLFKEFTDGKEIGVRITRISGLSSITEELKEEIKMAVSKKGRVLIILPRHGYSLIYCPECDKLQGCSCGGFYVFFKDENILRCSRCRRKIPVVHTCIYCRGYKLEFRGSGIEKVMEEIHSIKDVSISMKKSLEESDINILIRARGTAKGDYRLGVVLDADIFLNIPDYRAEERLFNEVFSLRDILADGGKIIIQTRMPDLKIFSYIKRFNYKDFSHDELKKRKELNYPPFSRFLAVSVKMKNGMNPDDIRNKILKQSVEILDYSVKDNILTLLLRLKRGVDASGLNDYFKSLSLNKIEIICDTEPLS